MYYVYVLFSVKDRGLYIGQTKDLGIRVKQHNQGKVKSTKSRLPLELLYWSEVNTRVDALKLENDWKTTAGRRKLRKLLRQKLK